VTPALAHGGQELTDENLWQAWRLTPEVTGAILIALVIYLRGARRRDISARGPTLGRHLMFFAGLASLFLALQSPIDPMGERLFLTHQIQHLLLRMLGPMLIVLARPEGTLISGLPRVLRRRVLAPMLANGPLNAVFRTLMLPWVAFGSFVGTLYFWQIPAVHNLALRVEPIHYLMHMTMILAGFVFFAMIFDRRDGIAAAYHGKRVFLLFAAILSNIFLGALTTLKTVVLYTAYDAPGRLFGTLPLDDESGGGYVIWVPASMMCIIAIIIVMRVWNDAEERRILRRYEWSGSNTAALEFPQTAQELRLKVDTPNRRIAQSLGLGVMTLFVVVIATTISIVYR